MTRDKFFSMFNSLIDLYKPRVLFDNDDYFDQVKYLNDNIIDKLRKRIIESCEFFPKPAELKKISKEFQLPFVKKEHPNINYDNCFCGKPVYNVMIDPYLCKEHTEYYQKRIEEEHKGLISLGYPVDQVGKGDNKLLQSLLEKTMAGL